MTKARSRRVLLLAAILVACGGKDRGRPSGEGPAVPAPEVNACELAAGYEFQSIVDFDYEISGGVAQCDPRVFVPAPAAPSCLFLNYDAAHSFGGADCRVALRPDQFADVQTGRNQRGEAIPERRCDADSKALHLAMTNVATCYGSNGRLGWGASLEVLLTVSSALNPGNGGAGGASGAGGESSSGGPGSSSGSGGASGLPPGENGFDASAWDGLSFWVRKGSGPSGASLIVSVADPATAGPPYCSIAEIAPDTEKCDAFGLAVTLTEEWTFVPALFTSFRQKGFGVPSPFGQLDSGNIVRLQVLVTAGDWDFWLDDLAFFRARP